MPQVLTPREDCPNVVSMYLKMTRVYELTLKVALNGAFTGLNAWK